MRRAASVGIIGGSDGPTAIFVAGQFNIGSFIVVGAVILAVVLGLYLIFRRKK